MNILTHNIRKGSVDVFNLMVKMGWQCLIKERDLVRYMALFAYRSTSSGINL